MHLLIITMKDEYKNTISTSYDTWYSVTRLAGWLGAVFLPDLPVHCLVYSGTGKIAHRRKRSHRTGRLPVFRLKVVGQVVRTNLRGRLLHF